MPESSIDGSAHDRFAAVMREPTLSDRVVQSVTDAIVSGRLRPGDQLDSERELAEQFGVSRTVIREAIRSLTALGLVESRAGRGVQVTTVKSDSVSRSMSLFLRGHSGIDYAQVHEVRSALELEMTAAAARRATREDLEALAELVRRLSEVEDDAEAAARLDVEFHRGIAKATHNDLFVVMLDSIGDVLLDIRLSAFRAKPTLEYAIRAHSEILEGLERRDVRQACAAMRAHLETADRVWMSHDLEPA